MLTDAIREIRTSIDESEQTRRHQGARMAPLRRAETYEHGLEELLLGDEGRLPDRLAAEIRRFVVRQCPGLADSLGHAGWTQTCSVLDLLFELQEVLQERLGLVDLEDFEAA